MKKTIILTLSFLAFIVAFSACMFLGPSIKGNGNVTTSYRDVGDFEQLKVSTGLKVILKQTDRNQVIVEADENLHDVIQSEVRGDELRLYTDQRIKNATKMSIIVEFKDIDELHTNAGASVSSDGILQLKNLETKSSSGSSQDLKINLDHLEGKVSSGANMKLAGKAQSVNLKASSGAILKAGELTADACFADASSGANIHIKATKKFEGEASSGGNIFYSGNPETVEISTSSGGNVLKR